MPDRTTLQVKRDLLPRLDSLKRELGASSYDAVIRTLIRDRRRLRRTHFGRYPKLRPLVRDELDRLD